MAYIFTLSPKLRWPEILSRLAINIMAGERDIIFWRKLVRFLNEILAQYFKFGMVQIPFETHKFKRTPSYRAQS
jgi:hypothetical protein